VISYSCDRARSITWGIEGGLPSLPHGVWVESATEGRRFLGAVFSNVPIEGGDAFTRPSAGGGGYGDPLERDPARVCEDVADGYVSIERAARDYGVVIREVDADLARFEVDDAATQRERASIRAARRGWLEEDAASVAARYRAGELDALDLIRRYGVIVDWGTGALFPRTTAQFRAMLQRRSAAFWD
jgi:N-methylhydantoinase B